MRTVCSDRPDSAANADLADGHTGGYKVELPAAARGAVTFPVTTRLAGTANFQFVAAAGDFGDAAECEVPVYTPATSEAFATYGDIAGDQDVVLQPVRAPGEGACFLACCGQGVVWLVGWLRVGG